MENQKEKPKEKATPTEDDGVQSETVSELDKADQIAERQKRENDRREGLLTREENLEARRKVGGTIEGGQAPVEKEETPLEYRDRIDKEISEGKHDD